MNRYPQIVPLYFKIVRAENGKKNFVIDGVVHKSCPKFAWTPLKDSSQAHSLGNFAIKCNDLIVLDCDSVSSSEALSELISRHEDIDPIIIVSDKGEKHFYFRRSAYYEQTALYSTTANRKRCGNIDVLQNRAMAFAPAPDNETKTLLHPKDLNIYIDRVLKLDVPEIPDDVVDYLISLVADTIKELNSNSQLSTLNRYAALIKTSLSQYRAQSHRVYAPLAKMYEEITPYKYKVKLAKYAYHPNFIEDGDGTSYLQALGTKLAVDPSIDEGLFRDVMQLTAQELWDSPYPDDRLEALIDSFVSGSQKIDGKQVWQYNDRANISVTLKRWENAPSELFVAENGKDVILFESKPVVIKNLFNVAISKGMVIYKDGEPFTLKKPSDVKELISSMDTARIVSDFRRPYGLNETSEAVYELNTYKSTRFLDIINNNIDTELELDSYSPKREFPTIHKIFTNMMHDNLVHNPDIIDMWYKFLAIKLTTFDYSPLVFHLAGAKGVGKNLSLTILHKLTNATAPYAISNPPRFNSSLWGTLFAYEDEIVPSTKLLNNIKEFSGNSSLSIEQKFQNIIDTHNAVTLMLTTNSPKPLSSDVDDRRIIMFSSFAAEPILDHKIITKIDSELLNLALYLRDLARDTKKGEWYTYAPAWGNKETLKDSIEMYDSSTETVETIAIVNAVKDIDLLNVDPIAYYDKLETYFGSPLPVVINSNGNIHLVLASKKYNNKMLADNKLLNHSVTPKDLREFLGRDIKRFKNTLKSKVVVDGKQIGYYYFTLPLPTSERKKQIALNYLEDGVKPLNIPQP